MFARFAAEFGKIQTIPNWNTGEHDHEHKDSSADPRRRTGRDSRPCARDNDRPVELRLFDVNLACRGADRDDALELPAARPAVLDAPAVVQSGGLRHGRRGPKVRPRGRHAPRPRDRHLESVRRVVRLGQRAFALPRHGDQGLLGRQERLLGAGGERRRHLAGLCCRLSPRRRRCNCLRLLGQQLHRRQRQGCDRRREPDRRRLREHPRPVCDRRDESP